MNSRPSADETEQSVPLETEQSGPLETRIAATIRASLETMGFELVRVLILGRERPTVQIMADRADGSLITVEDCTQISHAVSAMLDVDDPIPGAWNLEVSSAGIDRPLTRLKDWVRFVGHQARVEMLAPVEGRRRFTGIIVGAENDTAIVRLDDGTNVVLPLRDLRRAKLLLTDALIDATARPDPETTSSADTSPAKLAN
jgi:ribosome maturation factor RimP